MTYESEFLPQESYIRVATACPEIGLADVATNVVRISELYQQAADECASVVVFPELSLTGYTLGDLVQQSSLLNQAAEGLGRLARITAGRPASLVVGLPLRVGNGLYNCAAVLAGGSILGIVPKTNLPTYSEFYENRWYQVWDQPNTEVKIGDQCVPFGTNLLFDLAGVKCGVEICEDLWAPNPPSGDLVEKGAQLILNPSASPEQIGKKAYRRDLVRMQSGRLIAGYIYAGSDTSESTAEVVMGGHQLITANGQILAEKQPFGHERLLIADVDIDHLEFDRRKQHMATQIGGLIIEDVSSRQQEDLRLKIDPNPFLPKETSAARRDRLESAFQIQAHGLAMRMKATHQDKLVLGLSGGLDSTLALLVAYEAAHILGKSPSDMIQTITMPGLASSAQTQDNARKLAEALFVPNDVIPINELAAAELAALGHDGKTQDVTYENVQARARTNLLFNYANQHHAMVLGTGDLSEIALGWCTYNGDQQSHYNVNASIPKTLVRDIVKQQAAKYVQAVSYILAILATPISPELTSSSAEGISQSTEDIIGPYELHDFFLYHLLRWGDSSAKITYLANRAFGRAYKPEEIERWFSVFIERFSRNQFKRENLPNGPKVGRTSLSPRGDWRMPPDLFNSAVWAR